MIESWYIWFRRKLTLYIKKEVLIFHSQKEKKKEKEKDTKK